MTTNVEIYQEAFALATANLDATDPMAFEIAVPTRAQQLGLTQPQYQQFNNHTRQMRGQVMSAKAMDDNAARVAANAAKLAAEKPASSRATPPPAPPLDEPAKPV